MASDLMAECDRLIKMAENLRNAALLLSETERAKEVSTHGAQDLITVGPVLSGSFTVSPNRLNQIKGCIKKTGAMRTKDIIELTNIPRGTVSSLLKPENGFSKDEQGRWFVAS